MPVHSFLEFQLKGKFCEVLAAFTDVVIHVLSQCVAVGGLKKSQERISGEKSYFTSLNSKFLYTGLSLWF